MSKDLYILAGANGSGKSTIAKVLLPREGIVYINPDDIAREINPDDPVGARIEAGCEAIRRIDALLDRGDSFAVESTLSGKAHVKMIERAKALGYTTTIAYAFVDSAAVCIERIAVRVKNGGHDIPPEDVLRRYGRSRENFVKVYAPIVDHWMLYYNGGNDFVLVAHGNGAVNVIASERYNKFMEGLCLK